MYLKKSQSTWLFCFLWNSWCIQVACICERCK